MFFCISMIQKLILFILLFNFFTSASLHCADEGMQKVGRNVLMVALNLATEQTVDMYNATRKVFDDALRQESQETLWTIFDAKSEIPTHLRVFKPMERQQFQNWFPTENLQFFRRFCNLAIQRIDKHVENITDIQQKLELLFACGESANDYCVKLRDQDDLPVDQKTKRIEARMKFFSSMYESLISKTRGIKFTDRSNDVAYLQSQGSDEDILTHQMRTTLCDVMILETWGSMVKQLGRYADRQGRIFKQYLEWFRGNEQKAIISDNDYIRAVHKRFSPDRHQINFLHSDAYYEEELEQLEKELSNLYDLQRGSSFSIPNSLPVVITDLEKYKKYILFCQKNDQNIHIFLKGAQSEEEINILRDSLRNSGCVCDNLDEVYAEIHGFPYRVTAADVAPVVADAVVDEKAVSDVTACAASALACAATSTEELASDEEVTFDLPSSVWGDAERELSSTKPIWMIENKKKPREYQEKAQKVVQESFMATDVKTVELKHFNEFLVLCSRYDSGLNVRLTGTNGIHLQRGKHSYTIHNSQFGKAVGLGSFRKFLQDAGFAQDYALASASY